MTYEEVCKRSYFELAKAYERVDDSSKAFFWCKKALPDSHLCPDLYVKVCMMLGLYLTQGKGCQKDEKEGAKYYRMARKITTT